MKRALPQEEALASMLVPLASLLLRHGLSVGELSQAAKHAFVEAGIGEVKAEGQKPNISRLAVLTGLTRKEVSAIVKARRNRQSHYAKRSMKQRALRVLQGWRLDPKFLQVNGKPARLRIRGGSPDFRLLVKKYGGDVTPMAVLRELQRTGSVSLDRSGSLRLIAFRERRQMKPQFIELAQVIQDFVRSVNQNVRGERSLFRGFCEANVQSPDQVALFKRTFARRGVALLDGVADWAVSQRKVPGASARGQSAGKHRVGVGVYLVEDDKLKPR